jgi:hypothetical protein
MGWQSLIAALVELFAPMLLEWLRDLLKRSNFATGQAPSDPALAIHDAFSNARAQLSWLDRLRGRGAILNRCERVALSRARYIAGRCSGALSEVKLTGRELEQIAGS